MARPYTRPSAARTDAMDGHRRTPTGMEARTGPMKIEGPGPGAPVDLGLCRGSGRRESNPRSQFGSRGASLRDYLGVR
jgi:hypothetical protein